VFDNNIRTRKKLDPDFMGRILIRSTNWVGDAILTTPAIRAIRKNFPHSEITILAKPWVVPVFKESPHVDHIIIYDVNARHKGWRGKLKLIREIRKRKFDLAILFQNAVEAAVIALLSGIPRRLGYDTDRRGLFLTHSVPVRRHAKFKNIHETDYYLDILTPFGLIPDGTGLTLKISESNHRAADALLTKYGIGKHDQIVGVNPGATYGSAKRWLPERYAALADKIQEYYGAYILVFGAAGEKEIGQKVTALMKKPAVNLCGHTTLGEAMALIDRCHLFITNDSGLMHVATALEIPLVAIFGPTNSQTTGPTGSKSRVVRIPVSCSPCLQPDCPTDHRCMQDIKVDTVFEMVKTLHSLSEKTI
jgi:heptosyltransferase-2